MCCNQHTDRTSCNTLQKALQHQLFHCNRSCNTSTMLQHFVAMPAFSLQHFVATPALSLHNASFCCNTSLQRQFFCCNTLLQRQLLLQHFIATFVGNHTILSVNDDHRKIALHRKMTTTCMDNANMNISGEKSRRR